MLNPDSPLPLYWQLADELSDRIYTGELRAGTRIPSEHELAARYEIGRPTVRQATEVLVRNRLVERRRGAGTFVREGATEVDLLSLGGTLASFRRSGLELETRIIKPLRLRRVSDDPDNPFSMGQAYTLERKGSVKRTPVLLERFFFSASVFAGMDQHSQPLRSLSQFVEKQYLLSPRGGRQTFRVAPAEDRVARALRLPPRTPLLLVKRTLDFPRAPAAVFAELHCHTEEFAFSQKIGDLDHG